MPVIPTRFVVEFGEVFPLGGFVLGVEPSMAFFDNPAAPKLQERDKESGQLVWIVRALDANEEAARFGAEFKVKIAADYQPVPPAKANGFPFAAVEFERLTITPYANNKGRIAHSFRATGMRALGGARGSKSAVPAEQKTAA
ncbi:plasmid replication, integration and excision activator [Actinokineospora sp. HUAS TT18]|uniref:plasmid replication, integration and excision activator n=1 Tax=Actinokineospora sp. HUAS TT18 TaxID=3447451 RepID=UPI003F522D1E